MRMSVHIVQYYVLSTDVSVCDVLKIRAVRATSWVEPFTVCFEALWPVHSFQRSTWDALSYRSVLKKGFLVRGGSEA